MIIITNVRIPKQHKLVKAQVVVEKGRISEVLTNGDQVSVPHHAERIDGEGGVLLPGLVDPHVHVREPGQAYKEDWSSCSRAALKGGFVSIFDMPNNPQPVADYASLIHKMNTALEKSYVNFGLYAALTDNNLDVVSEPPLQDAVCGIKVYLSRTTGDIVVRSENSLEGVFRQGKPVLVHTGGQAGLEKVFYYYRKASRRYASLPPLYLCHTSTAHELNLIRKWKKEFHSIVAEATPHHLFLEKSTYRGYPGVQPPLAARSDVDALWEGISDGTIDLIGTDHAPHTVEEKTSADPPSGFPGLETALPLIFEAYRQKRLFLYDLIRLTSTTAGKLFGLGQGGIAAGEAADGVLLREEECTIGEQPYETRCGWSPFSGWRVTSRPVMTMVNGIMGFHNGTFYRPKIRYLCK
ncbi:MAG: dihydroorotase [Spirochaetota bacterium]